jgi:hypothetical protein
MNCRDIDRALIEQEKPGSSEWPTAALGHLAACERCQALVRLLDAPLKGDMPSREMLLRIERSLIRDLRPTQPLPSFAYFFAAFAATFVLLVAFGAYRIGASALSVLSPIQAAAIFFTLAASATMLSYSLVRQMVPGSRQLPPMLVLSCVSVLLILLVAGLFRFRAEPGFWQTGLVCLGAGVPYALVAAVPFWVLLRQGAVLSPRMVGAIAGLLAGLTGTSVLEIHCSNFNAFHILTWHIGVAALGAAGGVIASFIKLTKYP